MATTPFDVPIELRSTIFESLSLRDISRLRQTCSAWKNNLQDLSFLKVLDFSYSPDIPAESFKELIEKRINTSKNNIAKVIIAHTLHLTVDSLEILFQALPRIKDIRIRHSLTEECLPILLRQKNLECLIYSVPEGTYMSAASTGGSSSPLPSVECTKLTRCKLRLEMYFGLENFDALLKMRLLELNPVLKNDIEFMSSAILNPYDPLTEEADKWLKSALSTNNVNVYFKYIEKMRPASSYAPQLLKATIQMLSEMTEDQRQTNNIVHQICYSIFDKFTELEEIEDAIAEEFRRLVKDNLQWLKPLAALHTGIHYWRSTRDKDTPGQQFEKLKKRPFHKAALEGYLYSRLQLLRALRHDIQQKDKYEEELNSLVETMSSVMKILPKDIILLRASLFLRQGKLKEAFDEFLSGVEPDFVFGVENNFHSNLSLQAFFGAYHVAKDYLKSPELLEQLSPENLKLISEHFEKLQPCFDKGLCTRSTGSREYYKQYWYACYTCDYSGTGSGLCYSCTKTCHAGHEIDYFEVAVCFCDDTNCKFEDEEEQNHEHAAEYEAN